MRGRAGIGALVTATMLLGPVLAGCRSSDRPDAAPLSDRSGAAVLDAAEAAALAAGSVHTDTALVLGKRRLTYSDDDGAHRGRQVTTKGSARAEVRVVGSTTYFTGNRAALRDYFRLPPQVVDAAGTWFRVRPSDAGYATVTAGVTLRSTLKGVELTGPLTVVRTGSKHGVPVVGVRGDLRSDHAPPGATGTLWVRATGQPLPVEFDGSAPRLGLMTTTFRDWGVPVHVTVPAKWRDLSAVIEAG